MGGDFRSEAVMLAAKSVHRETERWMWKAIHRGPGWRVWRSDPRYAIDKITYDFMLVPPGSGHRADGQLYALPINHG